MTPTGINLAFAAGALCLTIAFVIRLPSIIHFWRDPFVRAVGGLLVLACCVFVFAAPPTIAKVNDLTGVANFSAPWVYTLLTAFCASCLVLILIWRGGPAAAIRRSVRWVIGLYTGVIVVLWLLFALADVPTERLRDLDTYYANAPYMREVIVLYLLAHLIACVVTSCLIWSWKRRVEGWLRSGLFFLGTGYLLNICYDCVKFAAVVARWTGNDLDWLSTHVAPPVACGSALLISIGFILPHVGQRFQEVRATCRSYRRLAPLARALHGVVPPTATVKLRPFVPKDLLLVHRETFIRDGMLHLAPFLDEELRRRAEADALRTGSSPADALALAGAVAVLAAVAAKRGAPRPDSGRGGPFEPFGPLGDGMRDIGSISAALKRPAAVAALLRRVPVPEESVRP
ncbi:MAB_1171c family putative transporter [Streptomyces sp. NPDC051567]|uniref:MAB_1171c family putative transporter n=1 Tax=Streptomyces sp. NPDC051567 TaxID=3365660 RepID=UPI0037951A15